MDRLDSHYALVRPTGRIEVFLQIADLERTIGPYSAQLRSMMVPKWQPRSGRSLTAVNLRESMLFNKENKLSASVFGRVLNSALYDGDCSPAAREYLAAGDIESAIGEWRRLADLGSARARCILAYLSFAGTPLSPADIDEAKRIALTAVAGERYAARN